MTVFQVVTHPLSVEEGGETQLGPQNLLLSDVDSMEEALQVRLQREPQHGSLHLGHLQLQPGHAFTVQDLKILKVRSEICLIHFHNACGIHSTSLDIIVINSMDDRF